MPTIDELLNSGDGTDNYYGEIFTPADVLVQKGYIDYQLLLQY